MQAIVYSLGDSILHVSVWESLSLPGSNESLVASLVIKLDIY